MSSEARTAPSTNPAARVQTYVLRRGRRRLFSGLLLAGVALGTLSVIIAYRDRARLQIPAETVQPIPDNARQSAAGYSFTRSEGGHPVFTIRAERSFDLKAGGGTILEGVHVEIFGRAGDQHNLLQTERCEYKPDSGDFFCAGLVKIELDAPPGSTVPRDISNSPASAAFGGRQPIDLQTSALSYNQQKSLATTAARVDWRYGETSGSASGLRYAAQEGRLELEHDVQANLPLSALGGDSRVPAQGDLRVRAARLEYVKEQIELAGPVQVTNGAREVNAGHAVAYLDARNRITRAVLDNGVRASDPSEGSSLTAQATVMQAGFDPLTGYLKTIEGSGSVLVESKRDSDSAVTRLQADHVQTTFVGAHFHPAFGTASGHVHVSSQGSGQRPQSATEGGTSRSSLSSEDLSANQTNFTFRPADGTLTEAHTLGPGRLLLVPASRKAGKREVTAGQFNMAFDGRSRLEGVRGSAPTRIVFDPAPGAPPSAVPAESRAQDLQARLDPETGGLRSIEQSGQFQFLHADERATADRAEFRSDAQVLTLLGAPKLTDPETMIQADRVVMHLATNTAEGFGHVSSIRSGGAQNGLAGIQRQAASEGSSFQGTNVLADRVTADRARGLLHYEGHVKAWRGADVVESPALDLYRAERRIVAGSPVLTSDLAPAMGAPPASTPAHARAGTYPGAVQPPGATQPAVIRADRLQYFDREHRAAYRGHVRMDASGATLNSDRLDAYFTDGAGEASTLDHAVADGGVTIVEPGRRATGDHAQYDAAEGKVVLTGGPPSLYDSEKGFVTGQILTFFIEGGSLLIDGGDGYRTLSTHHSTK